MMNLSSVPLMFRFFNLGDSSALFSMNQAQPVEVLATLIVLFTLAYIKMMLGLKIILVHLKNTVFRPT